ncbi:MAG: hypothetical protein GKR87_13455 [Kiritimatiellae bacterium]|nr:hypothetical protein [Kiritimatiellia bacterium]
MVWKKWKQISSHYPIATWWPTSAKLRLRMLVTVLFFEAHLPTASISNSVHAAETTTAYTLSDCLRIGLENNLQLKQLKQNVWIAKENIDQASAVYDPGLAFSVNYEDSELPSRRTPIEGSSKSWITEGRLTRIFSKGTILELSSGLNHFKFPNSQTGINEIDISLLSLSLSQPLFKNAKGQLDQARIREARLGYEQSELEFLYQRDLLTLRIYEAYWDLYAAQKGYETNQEALERSKRLLEINRKKYEDGLLDETDILAIEASLATREIDVLDRQNAVATQRDHLMRIIHVPFAEWGRVEVVYDLTLPNPTNRIDALNGYETALLNRQDYAALQKAVEQAETFVTLKKEEMKSTLLLTGRLGQGDTDTTISDSFGFDDTQWAIGLEWEMAWGRKRKKSALRQAEILLEQANERVQEHKLLIAWESQKAARELRVAQKRISATQKSQKLETHKLTLENEKLHQGRSSIHRILEYQDDLEFAELASFQSIADYEKKQAQHKLVQGTLPPRY